MTQPDTSTTPPGTPGPDDARPPHATLLKQLQSLWGELPGLFSDRVELLSLELQRAIRAMVQIVALVVAAAILGVTAWLLLWAGILRVLADAGLPWAVALLLGIAANGLAIVLCLQRVRGLLPRLRLPATRRHLTISPDPTPEEGRPDEPAAR